MQFTLFYRGELKSNGNSAEKHKLRRCFHQQLKELWKQPPLDNSLDWLSPSPRKGKSSIIRRKGNFQFAPLVSQRLKLIADLEIMMLRPEPHGSLITSGGDIDNRLKTLFDALKCPLEPNSLPRNAKPQAGETPLFCLLEDDNLIASVAVKTEQLLIPQPKKSKEIVMMINVKVRATNTTMQNFDYL